MNYRNKINTSFKFSKKKDKVKYAVYKQISAQVLIEGGQGGGGTFNPEGLLRFPFNELQFSWKNKKWQH